MQFPYRILAVSVVIVLLFLIQSLWNSQSTDEDQETKILRLLATLETHVTEYEAAVRSLRAEMLMINRGDFHASHSPGRDAEGRLSSTNLLNRNRLKTGSIYNALPYLLDYDDALIPALTIGKDRESVSVVIGIPTVKRPTQSYLLPTLQNLINSMLPSEKNDTLVIVFIAEPDVSFVQTTVNSITKQFKRDVDSGLIEIIAPSANYYPDFKNIKGTLGDSDDRTRWRTKQNLDYAYLMMYAQHRGTWYVQLEDDVLSKKGFVTTMKNFALQNSMKLKRDWFMLDFCQLGFIGKLFRSSDLWKLVEFFLIFYKDKPGDWLLSQYHTVKYCKLDYSHKRCVRELNKHWIHYKPSLFQHIGMVSSLNGKVQKLKDRQFGKLELFTRHDNPEAKVESTIKHYGKFSLEKAYQGSSFFWGLAPEAGDTIKITFEQPIHLTNYRFISGNAEHPSDKIHNATFEVLPSAKEPVDRVAGSTLVTKDGYVVIDYFGTDGVLDGQIPEKLNPIKIVRITLKEASENWVILSEILLEKS